MSDADAIEAGKAAWTRIKAREYTTWNDWLCIGHALVAGRRECMRIAGTNFPQGGRYNYAANGWLTEHGFADVCAQERHRIVKIIENLPAVEAWRATLSPEDRRALNHPSLWFKYAATTRRPASVSPGPRPIAKGTGYHGKLPRPSQDTIRIVAAAMRQNWTNDTYVLGDAVCKAMLDHREIFIEFLNAGRPAAVRRAAVVNEPAPVLAIA